MSQASPGSSANLPAGRPAAAPSSDAPDIMFIIKHFRWMLVIGTVIGLIIGVGAYVICKKYFPRYTVFAQYRVLPQSDPQLLDDTKTGNASDTAEEILRAIRRQALLVKSDMVLEKVLVTDAFQKNYKDPTQKSQWLQDHPVNPKGALRKQVEIVPEANSDVFRIQLTDSDPKELEQLVNAISDTYFTELRNNERSNDAVRIKDAKDAYDKLNREVLSLSQSLDDFRQTRDITAITNEYMVVQSNLSAINQKIVEAQLKVTASQSAYESMKSQIASGKFPLTADMEQMVENDPTLRYLEQSKFQLIQDRAALLERNDENHPIVRGMDAKIKAAQKQVDDKREELRRQARIRMQENSEQDIKTSQAILQDLTQARDKEARKYKDLDKYLVEYKSKDEELTAKKKLLQETSDTATRYELRRASDWSRIQRFSAAVAPDADDITFPKLSVFAPGGFILGLAVAFGIAYLLELTNTRIRTPRDVTRTMQLPLLGFVPDQQEDSFLSGNLATSVFDSPGSMTAESFRMIRGRLAAQSSNSPVQAMLIASISPGGGSTTVASNLAHAVALNGLRVLLIDANFYRPGLQSIYHNIPELGLTDLVNGKVSADKVIVVSESQPHLYLMGPGTAPATSASQMIECRTFKDTLAQLRNSYDVIIFDGGPLSLVADSIALAAKVDGVIAVVRAGVITRGVVARVREQLRNVHASLIGVVLNATRTRGSGYFKENYRTFYEYAGGKNGEVVHHGPVSAGRH